MRFSNPDEQLPLDYINVMMFPILDALFDKFRLGLICKLMHCWTSTKAQCYPE